MDRRVAYEPNDQEPSVERHSRESASNRQHTEGLSNRVYVGNIAWGARWQNLKDHMRQFGGTVVSANILMDAEGYSKGCGIVEYAEPEEAREAIEKLHNTDLMGRKIFVREDRESSRSTYRGGRDYSSFEPQGGESRYVNSRGRGDRRDRGYRGDRDSGDRSSGRGWSGSRYDQSSRGRSGYPNTANKIFVRNLPDSADEEELKSIARCTDHIQHVDVFRIANGESVCGTVLFDSSEHAQEALENLNGMEYKGRELVARFDRPRRQHRY